MRVQTPIGNLNFGWSHLAAFVLSFIISARYPVAVMWIAGGSIVAGVVCAVMMRREKQ